LFLKDLTEVKLLARRLLYLFYRRTFGATPHEQHSFACKRNCSSGFGELPIYPREFRTRAIGSAYATLPAGTENAATGGAERSGQPHLTSRQYFRADAASTDFRTSGFLKYLQEYKMSKSAAGFLILALLSGVVHLSLFEGTEITLPLIGCGVFAVLFVLAMAAGRKIKFDPVLR
jgi:hypothetical protein